MPLPDDPPADAAATVLVSFTVNGDRCEVAVRPGRTLLEAQEIEDVVAFLTTLKQ